MDGRLKRLMFCGLACAVLPAVGCRLFAPKTPAEIQAATPGGSLIQQAGFKQQSNKFGPPPADAPTPARAKKGPQQFKPETDIAIADVELEAAFDETRSGTDRDRIIDVARQRYQEALRKDPKNKDGLLGLAKLYTWANDKERAVATYKKALDLYPKDKEVVFALMRTQVRFEDWAGACAACKAAIDLDKENRTYRKAYGVVLARANRWQEALDALVEVMTESEARTFLGRLLIDTGKVAEGQQQLEAAITADPSNDTPREVLAGLNEYLQQQQGTQPAGGIIR